MLGRVQLPRAVQLQQYINNTKTFQIDNFVTCQL